MSTTPPITRRAALRTLSGLAGLSLIPSRLLGQEAPSKQLTKAIIGCGGISASHLGMPGRLLALCDVDRQRLDGRMQQARAAGNQDVRGYHDFREIIARDDIDVIHIATPPHWHAYMAIAAAKAGKAIWCEKPMTRTIGESLLVRQAVEKFRVPFRLNTWFRFQGSLYGSNTHAPTLRKAMIAGLIGAPPYKVVLNASTGFNWKFHWIGKKGLEPKPIPEHFDYDRWLGPAPEKPYHPHRTHGTFRGYWDYDGGGLGDMGQHYLDPIQYILGKDDELPIRVEIDAAPQDSDAVGTWRRIEYTYQDGTQIILDGEDKDKDAVLLRGDEGFIATDYRSNIKNLKQEIDNLPPPPTQVTDFHQAIKEGKKFALNESNGFYSCTLVNLGKIAHRTNSNLVIDPEKLKITNNAEANALINQTDRPKWSLPTI